MGLSADAYARQLKQLLPRGLVWKLDPASWLSKLLLGISDELARIDARSDDLLNEWDPRTAFETLPEWERMMRIPDGCLGVSTVTSERQAAVTAKWIARGGAAPTYFIGVAARLGIVATIDELAPYTWRLNVNLAQSTSLTIVSYIFRTGTARTPDPLTNISSAAFECVMNRLKPAHTVLLFKYA